MTDEPVPPQTATTETPTSPTDLPPPDWKESIRRAVKEFKEDRGSMAAAGMAFYWFLAIFPAILAAVGILGLANLAASTVDDISNAITKAVPGDTAKVLTEALNNAVNKPAGSSILATAIGLVVALWSASAGMVALQSGCNVAYDVPEDRKFLPKRGVALLLVGVVGLLAGVATTAIVFGQPLGDALRDNLPFGDAFVVVWTLLRWTVGLLALIVLFACIYSIAPYRETPRWTWVTPGGILATAAWLLVSLLFSFYVNHVSSYQETYGSLTGVVVLLLWLYLSAMAVVLGAELNAELERQGQHRREQRRGGRRGLGAGAGAQRPQAERAEAERPEAERPEAEPPERETGGRRGLGRALRREREPAAARTQPLPAVAPAPGRSPVDEPEPGAGPPPAEGDGAGSYQDAWLSYGRRSDDGAG
ncbi:MAG TPA: YihY/virulence factor BrkB family protein [Acidimicrobiales bacterium]|nr:YihY/virulence factor BrkB family protein [Acidimicrobiales bacterium]